MFLNKLWWKDNQKRTKIILVAKAGENAPNKLYSNVTLFIFGGNEEDNYTFFLTTIYN